MKLLISLSTILLFAGFGCKNIDQQVDKFACKINSDCALTVRDCCNCNNGGARIAVNKKAISQYRQENQKKCGEIFCMAVISQHKSCKRDAKALCKNNKCILDIS